MIKKVILAIMVAIPMCIAAQAPKFGIVNYTTVMEAMPEAADAQTQLEKASKQYNDEYQKLREDVEKKYTEFQNLNDDSSTPQAIKDRRIQEIQDMENKVQQFASNAQQDLQRQQQQLMAPIEEKLTNAINAVGSENGFTVILPEGVAAFIGSTVEDVTPLVKAKLGLK